MKKVIVALSLTSLALGCKPPAPPPATTAPSDAPPSGANVMGGKPTADAKPAANAPIPFEQAIKIDVTWDKARQAAVAKIHLEPGFHAYGPGEETGKPLAMELNGDGWNVKDVQLPKGETKDLGELGKSVVVTGDVEAVMLLTPLGDPKTPVNGVVKYQVCSDKSCDRPRSQQFTINPS